MVFRTKAVACLAIVVLACVCGIARAADDCGGKGVADLYAKKAKSGRKLTDFSPALKLDASLLKLASERASNARNAATAKMYDLCVVYYTAGDLKKRGSCAKYSLHRFGDPVADCQQLAGTFELRYPKDISANCQCRRNIARSRSSCVKFARAVVASKDKKKGAMSIVKAEAKYTDC
mmetsp:Transcript_9668/g.29127  ORF Transcript_9668/g.29127 Transcript_9668/m.29127 type:complete len:177 (+) Transcript_9668:232-762(+)|eukprot:CAMPEP_0206142316 /NCGR_PEP_ID=MMETSP1473-20131121/16387_1 /ASSEMBLY_ACC=CAM_ASM_001109 /TAXON_ID=1461547 /ORGANISM="Stichococcus sp, Strain RCC1054" /LENGTH=176 /DNA_ID=CAMNT_0053537263 /DNA_START=203 /DNA_END=733 /DNA_ORIENTATION=+